MRLLERQILLLVLGLLHQKGAIARRANVWRNIVSVIVKDSPVGLNVNVSHVKIEVKMKMILIFLILLSSKYIFSTEKDFFWLKIYLIMDNKR